jgi:hypothetical protein
MFEEINARLVAIQGELRRKDKYEVQLADYESDLNRIKKTISELQEQFESEKEDVEKLEHISLANLFATLAGTKEEKLSKERQELVTAQYKLEEARKTQQTIEEAMQDINRKWESVANAEEDYQQILLEKEDLIKTSGTPDAAKLLELSSQEGALTAHITELEEAIAAGEHVFGVLGEALTALRKAENWGTWDMLGGGTIAGMAKHQNIDQAESYLRQAQTSMRQFQKELLDVKESANLEVNLSGMLKFADFFFDGFFVDFMVQGKIQRSLDQARDQYDQVSEINMKLYEQLEDARNNVADIHREKQEIVAKL